MTTTRTRHAEPRPVEPMLTPDTTRCVCHHPTLIATFRDELLVALELRHVRGCAYPAQAVDVESWRKPW